MRRLAGTRADVLPRLRIKVVAKQERLLAGVRADLCVCTGAPAVEKSTG
jgi:hypothetical protein